MALSVHTAPGPVAGTLFQPIRALWWLAQSERGAAVGIEVLDDIACYCNGEIVALEQDKHSLTSLAPLRNRSVDLWKTLSIWLTAITDGEVDPEKTKFHLVTNRELKGGWVKALKDANGDETKLQQLVSTLRRLGETPAESIKDYVTQSLTFSDQELLTLLRRVVVEDASDGASGSDLRQKTIAKLHIPEEAPGELIYDGLLGWLTGTTLRLLDEGKDAIIDRNAFSRAFTNLIDIYREKRFREQAARLLTVTDEERSAESGALFVKQLLLLEFTEDEETVLDAIDDLVRRRKELTRFAKEGSITATDITAFEDRVHEKWKAIFSRRVKDFRQKGSADAPKVGLDILDECKDHRETLAGQLTEEYYLTRGTFHFLANTRNKTGIPILGWHPEFKSILVKPT